MLSYRIMSPFTLQDAEPARRAKRALTLHRSFSYLQHNTTCQHFLDSLAEERGDLLQGMILNEEETEQMRVLLDWFASREMTALFSRRETQKNSRPCPPCVQNKVRVSNKWLVRTNDDLPYSPKCKVVEYRNGIDKPLCERCKRRNLNECPVSVYTSTWISKIITWSNSSPNRTTKSPTNQLIPAVIHLLRNLILYNYTSSSHAQYHRAGTSQAENQDRAMSEMWVHSKSITHTCSSSMIPLNQACLFSGTCCSWATTRRGVVPGPCMGGARLYTYQWIWQ